MPRNTYCGIVAKFPTSVAFKGFAGYKMNRKVATSAPAQGTCMSINLINYQKVLEWPQYPLLKANFDWVPVKA
jgi:hypothetical protein